MKRNISISILLLSSILSFSCIKDDIETPDPDSSLIMEGDKVPVFTVHDGKGGSFSTADLTDKRTLLVFFTTTCGDCQRELKEKIGPVYQTVKEEKQCQVIAIARAQDRETIDEYWSKNNLTIPTYLDPVREVYALFAKSTIPRLYVINEEGIVEWMAIEVVSETVEEVIDLLKGK